MSRKTYVIYFLCLIKRKNGKSLVNWKSKYFCCCLLYIRCMNSVRCILIHVMYVLHNVRHIADVDFVYSMCVWLMWNCMIFTCVPSSNRWIIIWRNLDSRIVEYICSHSTKTFHTFSSNKRTNCYSSVSIIWVVQ